MHGRGVVRAWAGALALLACAGAAAAEPGTDPAAIRAEIAKVRRATDWADPESVKAGKARIQQLMNQLERGRLQGEAAAGAARGESAPQGLAGNATPLLNRASVAQDVQAAAQAGGSELLLGERVRKQVVEDYAEAYNPSPDNPNYLAWTPWLKIDFSLPTAALLVDELPRYQGVRHLILTGGAAGAAGAPVDLARVLQRARHLPLQSLAIYGFRQQVRALPDELGGFAGLQLLTVVDNDLSALPPALARLRQLQVLHLDINPLRSVLPAVATLPALRELGLARTQVPAAERAQIARTLPACKVLTQ
jgi:hypothetical protein